MGIDVQCLLAKDAGAWTWHARASLSALRPARTSPWYTFPPRQISNTMDAPVGQPLRSLPLATRRIDIQKYFTALTGRGADTPTTFVVDTTRRELLR